ncbi:MAG: GHKL domain-containing protein [Lachnospiraceae bacterium]|nr:GHKL domain-containing protein [Lachnospiraceae bacterium]
MEGFPVYSLLSTCLEVPFIILHGYCLQFFYGSFLESRMRSKKTAGFLTVIGYGTWKLGSSILWKNTTTRIMLLKLLITIIVLAVLALAIYRAWKRIAVFLILTFATINEISFFLSYMLLQLGSNLFDLWNWCFLRGCFSSGDTYLTLIHVTALLLQAGNYVVFLLILFVTLKLIVLIFREKDYMIHNTELLFILAPNLIGLLICLLLRTTIEMTGNDAPRLLYDRYPLLTLIIPAILILSLFSILCGVKLLQDMIVLSRERSSRTILEKQILSMQEHMAEMDRIYSGIRSMKHDMKNTLSVVMQLYTQSRQTDKYPDNTDSDKTLWPEPIPDQELKAYLSELNKSMDQLTARFKTGNHVADVLLNMKYHEFVRIIPDLQILAEELIFPEQLTIQSYDLGIILGNALDNAGAACRKLKEKEPDARAFIRLSSFRKGKFLFIKIENSFDGTIRQKKTSEFPLTDKKDKEAHGIGLINIRNTVEKYQGAVDWRITGRVFTLSVMIR